MKKSGTAKRRLQITMILYGSLPVDTRVLREVRVLADAGYDVSVLDLDWGLEGFPSPRYVRRRSVLRMPFLQRISSIGLLRFWFACLKYLIRNRQSIDIVHAHDLTGLPPAFVISILCPRIKTVYDSHEIFPEAALDKLSLLHYVLFLGLELICSTKVDWLFSVSPSCLRTLSSRIRAPSILLLNVPDLNRVRSILGYIPQWRGIRDDHLIKIVYPGAISTQRGYEQLPEAAQILDAIDEVEFQFIIVGDGPLLPELKRIVRDKGLEYRFAFTGRIGFDEMLLLMVDCDIALALYEETWNNSSGLSNKLFEYMMVGIPFIFTHLTQSMPILEKVGAPTLKHPASGKDIADAILSLHSNSARMREISREGLRLIEGRFNWSKESERLAKVYREIHGAVFG